MGYEKAITVAITGELADHVSATVGEYGLYETATEYVRDLIRRDIAREEHALERFKAELQSAFAEPLSSYTYVTAEVVIARNHLRD